VEEGDLPKMTLATRHLLPHERWLTERFLQKLGASPNLDMARAESEKGAESFLLAMVHIVDLAVGGMIFFSGVTIAAVVGEEFHEEAAGLAVGCALMAIGFAALVLGCARMIQSYRAGLEYQRTRPPFSSGESPVTSPRSGREARGRQ